MIDWIHRHVDPMLGLTILSFVGAVFIVWWIGV